MPPATGPAQICRCPQCSKAYRLPAGKSGKCPKCAVMLVPVAAPPAVPSSPAVETKTPAAGSRPGRTRAAPGTRATGRVRAAGVSSGASGRRASARGETGEKKPLPMIPIALGAVVIIVGVGYFLWDSGTEAKPSTPPPAAESTSAEPGTAAETAPVPPSEPDPIDWSKDNAKETDMAKKRQRGYRGELPPESYGAGAGDTGGRPVAGDGTPKPPAPAPDSSSEPGADTPSEEPH